MKTVLICGAQGFIGRHTVLAFQQAGWQVFGAGRSAPAGRAADDAYFRGHFEDRDFVVRVLQHARPDRVVFIAGPSSVQESFLNPVEDFNRQTLPLIQVLDGARLMDRAPGVVLVSSAAVYGNPASIPVSEDVACNPISPYGFHKLHQENLLKEFSALYGLPTCTARVFSTYGAGLRQLAVWDVTRRALRGDVTLHGTGEESRDYLHVSDVAAALEQICRLADFCGEGFNVASGVETPMACVAARIFEVIGLSEKPIFLGSQEVGKPVRWRANVELLNSLGFKPSIALARGVQETVEWIRANA